MPGNFIWISFECITYLVVDHNDVLTSKCTVWVYVWELNHGFNVRDISALLELTWTHKLVFQAFVWKAKQSLSVCILNFFLLFPPRFTSIKLFTVIFVITDFCFSLCNVWKAPKLVLLFIHYFYKKTKNIQHETTNHALLCVLVSLENIV